MMAIRFFILLAKGKVTQLGQTQYTNEISDGNIRYFEYTNDKFEYLSEYKSADPQRGVAFLPKRGVNVKSPSLIQHIHTNRLRYMKMKSLEHTRPSMILTSNQSRSSYLVEQKCSKQTFIHQHSVLNLP